MTDYTLLLRLAGPQQAWGARSRFTRRATELAPTKSGVIGLLAAALGMDRRDPLDRFASLGFGVRIDRPGRVERDFQTAVAPDGKALPLSHRYYLADAAFTAALASPSRAELEEFQEALRRPIYPLFLGRRAFPPAGPIATTLVDLPLREALSDVPASVEPALSYEVLADVLPGEVPDHSLEDEPVSFDPRRRRYLRRDVHVYRVDAPRLPAASPGAHDPMTLVSDEEV